MSEIRRDDDALLRRPVAIKLLSDDGDPRSVARFGQEAQILARLHHPNVVTESPYWTVPTARLHFLVVRIPVCRKR